MRILQPPGWPAPRGYAIGIAAEGRLVFVAGPVGWDAAGTFPRMDFAGQAALALRNVSAVLAEAGAGPQHVVRLTWYVLDLDEYRASRRALGAAWREVMGAHYPAMSLVAVAGLAEPLARLEIEATAVVPAGGG
jgi:enamine deaminase RidA (YjgF/YER057c/UK114 family)